MACSKVAVPITAFGGDGKFGAIGTRASDLHGGEGVRSVVDAALKVDTDSLRCRDARLCDPVELVQGLCAGGLSVVDAAGVVADYYRTVEALVLESPASPTMSSRDARRLEWNERMEALALDDGYCYLHAVRYARRERLRRVLGSQPEVGRLVTVLTRDDLDDVLCKRYSVYRVYGSDGGRECTYHVATECEYGVYVSSYYDFLSSYTRSYRALLGAKWCITDGKFVQLPLVAKIGAPKVLTNLWTVDMQLVSDIQARDGVAAALRAYMLSGKLSSNRLIVMSGGSDEGSVAAGSGWLVSWDATDWSAIVFPTGVRVVHDSIVYGCDGVAVTLMVREPGSLRILPSYDGQTIPWYYLSSTDYSWREAMSVYLPVKSSEARFAREMQSAVVLASPGTREPLPEVESVVVPITDPLQTWNAVEEMRYEFSLSGAECVRFDSGGESMCFRTFRSDGVMVSCKIEGCVVLGCGGRGVIFGSSDVTATLVRGETDSARTEIVPLTEASMRVFRIKDRYCMDGGGPSDSDFSDAF